MTNITSPLYLMSDSRFDFIPQTVYNKKQENRKGKVKWTKVGSRKMVSFNTMIPIARFATIGVAKSVHEPPRANKVTKVT